MSSIRSTRCTPLGRFGVAPNFTPFLLSSPALPAPKSLSLPAAASFPPVLLRLSWKAARCERDVAQRRRTGALGRNCGLPTPSQLCQSRGACYPSLRRVPAHALPRLTSYGVARPKRIRWSGALTPVRGAKSDHSHNGKQHPKLIRHACCPGAGPQNTAYEMGRLAPPAARARRAISRAERNRHRGSRYIYRRDLP